MNKNLICIIVKKNSPVVAMEKKIIEYYQDNICFKGYAAYRPIKERRRVAVLLCHAWFGQDDFIREKAHQLAEVGCLGFAVDMYGDGKVAANEEEAASLIQPLMKNRETMRKRLNAALSTVSKLPEINPNYIAILGFCFGGACALELARSGANIRAAISCHGLLQRDHTLEINEIKASILALHGYNDPLVSADDLQHFQEEMTIAQADWQLLTFGNTMHAFTNPSAHSAANGLLYNPLAAKRAWIAIMHFLKERLKKTTEEVQRPMQA